MVRAARTVIVKSVKLSRKVFRVFVELEGMYRNMLEQLTLYASRNIIKSFTSLKTQKYRELKVYTLIYQATMHTRRAKMLLQELRASIEIRYVN